jgi:hypothetical protein
VPLPQALYTLCTPSLFHPIPQFRALIERLSAGFGARHVPYRVMDGSEAAPVGPLVGALHFTLMQLIIFDLFDTIVLHRMATAKPWMQRCSATCRHSTSNFSRIIVTPKSMIMAAGHTTVDVKLEPSEQLRGAFAGLPLLEPLSI